jgi:serralysin
MPTPSGYSPYSYVNDSGTYYVDALMSGVKWGGGIGTGASLSYSFPGINATWISGYGSGEPSNGFAALSAGQQGAFAAALATWAEVANIGFSQVADTNTSVGDIRVGISADVDQENAVAWAYYPGPWAEAGDVWLAPSWYGDGATPLSGEFAFHAFVHEIGHSLGLSHSFDQPNPLPASQDSEKYTVMAYDNHPYATIHASEPMLYDIAAIQYLYGANMTTRTGNDNYSFSASTEELSCIWDAGGNDTLDASNQTLAATINLNAGGFSSIGIKNNGVAARDNVSIAFNVVIENANGGSGNDSIAGNGAANALNGNGGNDTLSGGGGNDTLNGGDGTDYAVFSAGSYTASLVNDFYQVVSNDGTDILSGIEWARFGSGSWLTIDSLLTGGGGWIGTAGNDSYSGTSSGDSADGLGGNDTLLGYGGNDTLAGNDGNDSVRGGDGNDQLSGGDGNDRLYGEAGNDTLDGGLGYDTLDGGYGNDVFVIDGTGKAVKDVGGIDRVEASISYTLGSGIENLTLTGNAAINGTGNSAANLIIGNGANNSLSGSSGNDTLVGGGGSDLLSGGKGRDVFDYNALSDAGAGGDVISGFARGSSGDILDLSGLLEGLAGYDGTNAFSGGYLQFAGSLVQVDADGGGGGDGFTTLVTLSGVNLDETYTFNYIV